MAEPISVQQLKDASLDVKSLEDVINGDDTVIVTTRLGETYPSVKGAIKGIFENGGLPAKTFPKKEDMLQEGASLEEGSLAQVYNDTKDNNGLYVKKSDSWEKSPYDIISLASEVADKKVDSLKSNVLNESKNLFDPSAATIGKFITTQGLIGTNASRSITDKIYTKAGTKYTLTGGTESIPAFNYASYFGINDNFLGRSEVGIVGAQTITPPVDTSYMRLGIDNGLPSEHKRMINVGDTALPYEPYSGVKLKEGLLSQQTIDYILSQQPVGNIADNYINVSSNLFDAETTTENKIIRDTGVIETTTNYAVSDFIPVEAGAKYTISGGDTAKDAFINTAYYDKDKVFIQRVDTWNRTTRELTITIPANVAFVRFNITGGLPTQFNRMFNKGTTALPYQKHYTHLTGLTLGDDVLAQISNEIVVSDADKFIFDTPLDGVFNTDQVWTQYTDFPTKKTVEVNQMYEDLRLQHPDYITKQVLGNNSEGKEIRLYKFKPARASTEIKTRAPIIYIVCGTHGGEDLPPLATYLMMEQICNNWRSDKLLEALRFNVEFLIIPISNPYGRDARTRKNANGVDIARSFPEGFGWQSTDPASPYYGGEAPMQELETQYIAQVMDENPNIDACYDFHNFGGTNRDYYLWIATGAGKKMQHMGQVLMQQMGRKWQAEFAWLPQRHDWFAGFVDSQAGATVHDHALAKGIKFAATFEVGREWQLTTGLTMYDQTHCKTMLEATVNWMLINLRNL